MNSEEFENLFEETIEKSRDTLVKKAQEYANDVDRLHNFKKAATFTGGTNEQALWGMATKHFISISDMVESGEHFSMRLWDEKLLDALNYLILLRAVVVEGKKPSEVVSQQILVHHNQADSALDTFERVKNSKENI